MESARPDPAAVKPPAGAVRAVELAAAVGACGSAEGVAAGLADIASAIAGTGSEALRWPLRTRSEAGGKAVFPAERARRRA
jgi:hypothetical protein